MFALNIFLIGLLMYSSYTTSSKNTPTIYHLGEITQPGYVGVKVTYDKEPVDIVLISPDDKTISKNLMSEYNINDKKHIIYAYYDTDKLGEWHVSLNQKRNKFVQYEFLQQPSNTIHIQDINIKEIHGVPHVEFTPLMSTKYSTKCNYSIIIENDHRSFSLDSGEVKLNKKAYITINPPDIAFNDEAYVLTLNVISVINEDGEKTSDHAQIEIILPKKEISEPEDETDAETSDTDSEQGDTDDKPKSE